MSNQDSREIIIQWVEKAVGEIITNETMACARRFHRYTQDGVTSLEIMVLTPELARIAKLAIQDKISDVDDIVISEREV